MVGPNSEGTQPSSVADDVGCVPGDPVKDDRQGRTVLSLAAVLIVVMMVVAWMFHGFSLARLILPDTAAAPPDRPAAAADFPSDGKQLYAWLAQLEGPLDALLVQRDNISTAAANADATGIQRACEAGRGTLPRLQKLLPGPDQEVNTALQRTIDDYGVGFDDCLAGVLNQDAAAIELSAVYLHRANNDLRTLMAVIARDLPDSGPNDSDVIQI